MISFSDSVRRAGILLRVKTCQSCKSYSCEVQFQLSLASISDPNRKNETAGLSMKQFYWKTLVFAQLSNNVARLKFTFHELFIIIFFNFVHWKLFSPAFFLIIQDVTLTDFAVLRVSCREIRFDVYGDFKLRMQRLSDLSPKLQLFKENECEKI